MKIQSLYRLLMVPMAGLCFSVNSVAQSFAINWSTIDGGGGSSSGAGTFGAFTLVGTIGQADAGSAFVGSGGYRITGGFWSFLGGGGSQAPTLRIFLAGTNAVLSWPNPSTGFALEEALALGGPVNSWSAVTQTPDVVGPDKQVAVSVTAAPRFYRLRKP
jgi:hypothetical protein